MEACGGRSVKTGFSPFLSALLQAAEGTHSPPDLSAALDCFFSPGRSPALEISPAEVLPPTRGISPGGNFPLWAALPSVPGGPPRGAARKNRVSKKTLADGTADLERAFLHGRSTSSALSADMGSLRRAIRQNWF